MDFTKETQEAINKVVAEQLPQMLENRASKMINDIVDDIFRWGDIKNQVKEKIESALDVNLQKFDMISYNALVAKTINDNLIRQVNLQPILDMTQDIIGFVNKKEISLHEICDMFKKASQEENEFEGEGEVTFIIDETDTYIEVSADIEPDQEKHKCSIIFCISKGNYNKGGIFIFRTREKYYDEKAREISPARLVNMDSIEAKIFRLYSAQVKVTDISEPSIYWDRY